MINLLKKESHFKFDKFCTKEKEYNKGFFTAIAKLISDLADLYTALGGLTAAKDMKKQEQFTKSVVVSFTYSYINYIMIFLYPGKDQQAWSSQPCRS